MPGGVERAARRAARRVLGRPQPTGLAFEANPQEPDTLDFRFFAVLGTWMEEDVVEATVANAFAQGVEAVYLVDNASTDATVERAVAAGATLAESFETEVYEEHVRILFMNAVVARVSLATKAPHVWWLWLDADEFPEGPNGLTVLDYLRGLDRRFRIVGSTYYNHFPDSKPEYLPGFHPIDFQPLCEHFVKDRPRYCLQPHWKHPLQRFDREGPFLMSIVGFHRANTLYNQAIVEPEGGIVTHHHQYRDEEFTRRRLDLLCGGSGRNAYNDAIGNTEIGRRYASLDAIYARRWDDVYNLRHRESDRGVHPMPWADLGAVRRWYDPSELEKAKDAWAADRSDATP